MPEIECKRTLVKSPPELWAELSDAESLARHLGEFGEIRITRVEPETTVAWEGERASGTVEIEPSGWGTKVRFVVEAPEPAAEIPDELPISLKGLEIGDTLHINDITLPRGSKSAVDNPDLTIATIVAPSAMKATEEQAAPEGAVPVVGEEEQ